MRGTGILTACVLALSLAACARGPIDTGQGYSGAGGPGAGGIGSGTIGTGGLGGGGVLPGTNIGDTVWFLVDQSTLGGQATAILDQQIGWLAANPGRIEIEGHADERGTDQYNIQLGARRAAAVRDYMVSRGIPDTRISTNTFGRARPIATCADESCWAQNRRAVTVVAAGAGV